MTTEELALEVVQRLEKNIQMQDVHWIIMKHGNYWSVSGWQHSVPMQG